jgi:hypothetical protein
MRPPISFKQFLALPEEIQEQLSTFDNEYFEHLQEELSPSVKRTKLKELEKLLKDWDYTYVYSDSKYDYKKGVAQEKEIIKLYKEIGGDGLKMYRKFLKSKGMSEELQGEARKDSRPTEYEKFLYSKMKDWNIKTLDELEGEAKRRFWKEMEDEYESEDENEVEVNMPSDGFSEMNNVEGRGTLDYAIRQVGEKSLTASSFSDGNLYPNSN